MENPRTRNDAIERLLREAGGTSGAHATGACAAPEQVAAWLEGGLSAPESAGLEAHVASCPECQALVAAFARTLPPAHGRAWTNLRWAAPLAAAAVLVLGVWLTRPDQRARSTTLPEAEVARLEAPPATGSLVPRPAAPERPAPEAPAPADPVGSQPDRNRQARTDPRSANQVTARQADAALVPPAPAAPAAAQATPAADAAAGGEEKAERSEARAKALASEAPARAAEGDRSASAFRAGPAAVGLSVASPSGRTRCRVGPGRAVETSIDGGLTWTAASGSTPAVAAALVGGASPSDGVCWLVGRGVVLLVLDGRATVVRPPDAGDLTTVRADDAAAAVVVGSDGRAWQTRDGGRTWSPAPATR